MRNIRRHGNSSAARWSKPVIRAGAPGRSDGIAAAQRAGDVQAQKEMQVFLRRLDKQGGNARRD
jgi:hypothetical protein